MKRVFNYLKHKWYFVIIVLILGIIAIWVRYDIINNNEIGKLWNYTRGKHIELATLFVLFITFAVIWWYTLETVKLRKVTTSNLFDSRFYKILEKRKELIEFLNSYLGEAEIQLYNNAFGKFYAYFKSVYTQTPKMLNTIEEEKDICNNSFGKIIDTQMPFMANYSYLLIEFIRFLKTVTKNKLVEEFNFYNSLYISSFSFHEIIYFFYFGIFIEENGGFIDEFKLFYNILPKHLLLNSEHIKFYNHLVENEKEIANEEEKKKGTSISEHSL